MVFFLNLFCSLVALWLVLHATRTPIPFSNLENSNVVHLYANNRNFQGLRNRVKRFTIKFLLLICHFVIRVGNWILVVHMSSLCSKFLVVNGGILLQYPLNRFSLSAGSLLATIPKEFPQGYWDFELFSHISISQPWGSCYCLPLWSFHSLGHIPLVWIVVISLNLLLP